MPERPWGGAGWRCVGAGDPLQGMTVAVDGAGAAAAHAARLLSLIGTHVGGDLASRAAAIVAAPAVEPAGGHHTAWAASGAVPLVGDADGPPRAPRWATAAAMDGAAAVFAALTELLGRRV